MSETGKYLLVGPYSLTLPEGADVSVGFSQINKDTQDRKLTTFWDIKLSKFRFFMRLSFVPLTELSGHIEHTTRSQAEVDNIKVGTINCVKSGSYDKPRTWIDWWLKQGDSTLCINLQSVKFPWENASRKDREIHKAMINSIRYKASYAT